MSKRLVFVGGGHAHLTSLFKLRNYISRGHEVILISPVTHHYYSGMGPGMLSQMYKPSDVRFNIKKMAEDRGATFIEARVIQIQADNNLLILDTGQEIPYDVVSFNTGSIVASEFARTSADNIFTVKPISNLLKAQTLILKKIRSEKPKILIIGGGPAGVELSGNIHSLIVKNDGQAQITLVSSEELLHNLAEKARHLARKSLLSRGVTLIENARVIEIKNKQVRLKDGQRLDFELAFLAVGVKPSPIFKDSGLPIGRDGGLLVNDFLQCVVHPNIFGGGDCISFQRMELDKVGVYAVRQNPILYGNLMAALEGGPMKKFEPQKVYLLIFNLGNGTGIFVRRNWVWNGRLAFLLKDYIDQKFMRKFQVSGERQDRSTILE